MRTYTNQAVGKKGERRAARYLRRLGYRVLARNVHCGKNELDLVVKNKQYLVFVEVKTRTAEGLEAFLSRPSEAVDREKRARTVAAAFEYLRKHPSRLCPRFDVVEVYLDREARLNTLKINHIEDAFSAKGATRR